MSNVGIICEYNPLHAGHAFHMREAQRRAQGAGVVCVLSGALVQRGEPAVADPWTRAGWALEAGADLVLYLPVAYSLAPADVFAFGGMATLAVSGLVDAFAFGSESADLTALSACADVLADEPEGFTRALKAALGEGLGYPAALTRAIETCPPHNVTPETAARIMKSPNDSLAVRYLMENKVLAHPMRPIAIRRDPDVPSASALREKIARGGDISPHVPGYVAASLKAGARGAEFFDSALCVKLRATPAQIFRELPDAEQTASDALIRAVCKWSSASAIVEAVSSKRYTRAPASAEFCGMRFWVRRTRSGRPQKSGFPMSACWVCDRTGWTYCRSCRAPAAYPY